MTGEEPAEPDDFDNLFEDIIKKDIEEASGSQEPIVDIDKVVKPVTPILQKSKRSYGPDLSKLFKDALTTRTVKPVEQPTIPIVPERSQMEKKFVPLPPTPPKPKPVPAKVSPKVPDFIDEDIGSETPESISRIIQSEMREQPLPVIVKKPKHTFLQKLKSMVSFNRFRRKVKEKTREMKSGLSARQRIKRFNSIHEGGYGDPSKTTSKVKADDSN